MEKIYRAAFFWTMVVLFIIVAPIVVLNAWGYHFDFSRGIVVKSGTISLKTNPTTANIYINGKPTTTTNVNHINNTYNIPNVIPDEYNLSVSIDGFQTWNKKTEVHSGLSSEFWNILLVRNSYEQKIFNSGSANKMFISPTDKFIAYTQPSDNKTAVGILNIKDETIDNTFYFSGWQFVDDARKENIEWSPSGDYLSIPLKKILSSQISANTKLISISEQKKQDLEGNAYFIADPANNNTFNLNDFLAKKNIRKVRWDPKEKTYLYFLSDNSLFRANIQDNKDITLIADNVSSYDLSKSGVYYTQMPNELLFKANFDGQGDRMQITYNLPPNDNLPTARLIVYDDLRIAFINTANELFIYNKAEFDTYFKKLSDNIDIIQFSDDGKKLLFGTSNEISVYFLRQWNTQPTRVEDETQNITRYAEKLSNIQWFKDYEHIIFSVGKYAKIIELDARDHRNCEDIFNTTSTMSVIVYNNSLENLFFIDPQADDSAIKSIIFPEKTGLFGL